MAAPSLLDTNPIGLIVCPNFIDPETEKLLIAELDNEEYLWSEELSRRTKQYLHKYDYKSRGSAPLQKILDPPPLIAALAQHLIANNVIDKVDQILVNEYIGDQNIAARTDHPKFGPTIISLSLGSACNMIFEKKDPTYEPADPNLRKINLFVEPRDLIIMSGPSRSYYTHEIPKRKTATSYTGVRFDRGHRISITFRSILRC